MYEHMKHNELEMADYLKENDLQLSVDERKWIFKCRTCGNMKILNVTFVIQILMTHKNTQSHVKHSSNKTVK